jgi:hypothetical protein
LVQFLPVTLKSLKKIKGIGAVKTTRFGAELLGMIQQYCLEKKLYLSPVEFETPEPKPEDPSNPKMGIERELEQHFDTEPKPVPKPPKVNTKVVSFELYQSGKNIAEIAMERGLSVTTITDHLSHFIMLGELDVFDLVKKEAVHDLETFFRENNTKLASEAKAYFGDLYAYDEIRLVLAYLRGLEGG